MSLYYTKPEEYLIFDWGAFSTLLLPSFSNCMINFEDEN